MIGQECKATTVRVCVRTRAHVCVDEHARLSVKKKKRAGSFQQFAGYNISKVKSVWSFR